MEVFNGRKVFSEIGYPKVGYIYCTISFIVFCNLTHYQQKKLKIKTFRWEISSRKRTLSFVCGFWMPLGSQSFDSKKNEKIGKCNIYGCGSFYKVTAWLAL